MSWLNSSLPLLTEDDRFGNLPIGTYFFLPFQPTIKFIKAGSDRATTHTPNGGYQFVSVAYPSPVWRVVDF